MILRTRRNAKREQEGKPKQPRLPEKHCYTATPCAVGHCARLASGNRPRTKTCADDAETLHLRGRGSGGCWEKSTLECIFRPKKCFLKIKKMHITVVRILCSDKTKYSFLYRNDQKCLFSPFSFQKILFSTRKCVVVVFFQKMRFQAKKFRICEKRDNCELKLKSEICVEVCF